ncbi:MAG: serine/threonine protein kinase [Holophagaceae bacterium]|nr:serine/threonine protein kinase [Holophagaceae bacterium]
MQQRLGRFEILKRLGQGAMGEVFLGLDPAIGREVALKTIHREAAQGAEARERFAREARAAGTLSHPNLVTIHEFGEDQGVLYLAMEFVPGVDLEAMLRDRVLAPVEALEVLAQVCDGLAYAHQKGRAASRHQAQQYPGAPRRRSPPRQGDGLRHRPGGGL